MRQLSPSPQRRGVLFLCALLLPRATKSCTCSSPKPSSWASAIQPSPVTRRPCESRPSRCMPLASTRCCQLVGSCWSSSAARMRSPAASCTLTRRSAHFMRSTMSRLICMVRPTPFSTANVWSSAPRHHRPSSDQKSMAETTTMATVHLPPPDVRCTYCGFAFAVGLRRGSVSICHRIYIYTHTQRETRQGPSGGREGRRGRIRTECDKSADYARPRLGGKVIVVEIKLLEAIVTVHHRGDS